MVHVMHDRQVLEGCRSTSSCSRAPEPMLSVVQTVEIEQGVEGFWSTEAFCGLWQSHLRPCFLWCRS